MRKILNDVELRQYCVDCRTVAEDDSAYYRILDYRDVTIESIYVKARRESATRWMPDDSLLIVHSDCQIYIDDAVAKLRSGEILKFIRPANIRIVNRHWFNVAKCSILQKK